MPLLSLVAAGTLPLLADAIGARRCHAAAAAEKDRFLAAIPPDASVIASFAFQPRLANRQRLYSLHHVYTGTYTLSDVPYPTPAADFVVLDTEDRLIFSRDGFYSPENDARLWRWLQGPEWKLALRSGSVMLFERAVKPKK